MRILFAGGGTLGPVTPLLATAEAIQKKREDTEFFWIGTYDGPEFGMVDSAGIPFFAVSSGKFRRYFSWRNFTDPFLVIAGFFQALRLLGEIKPDVVVSAGGFVAVPVIWAAGMKRIPVHVHQQDILSGLANRLSLPFASSVSVVFERSAADFAKHRPVWTGNPVRGMIFTGTRDEARDVFGLEEGVPTLLVLGGGTGAAVLNDLVRDAVPLLTQDIQILHVTGKGKMPRQAGEITRYHPVEFLKDEMRHAYAAADLVVTRAGMGTLTELAALGAPIVIVPMPGSHQELNAKFFAEKDAAVTMDERRLIPEKFAQAVRDLLDDHEKLAALSTNICALTRPDAAERVAGLIMNTAEGSRG